MKNFILFFLIFITISAYAQKDSGIVLYKVISKKEDSLLNIKNNNKKINLKSFLNKSAEFELTFKGDKSLYKRKVRFNKYGERSKINFFDIIGGSDDVFYCEKDKVIQSTNKYDMPFLIQYESDTWKLHKRVKK